MIMEKSGYTSEGVGARIVKKPYNDSIPKRFDDDLTDDLLVEIFLKLPAKILHRCKSVSKRWLSLISSSSFARSFIRLSNVPATKMLLLKHKDLHKFDAGKVYAIPLLHDLLVDLSSLPSSFDFIPALKPRTGRFLLSIHLVGTYGGLVLLQGKFIDRSEEYYNYYVSNPITKHWVELPLIRISRLVGFTCYYLQQAQGEEGRDSRIWADVASYDNLIKHNADYDPNRIEFTVVSIKTNERARVFVIHVLSSADGVGPCNRRRVGRWNIRRVPFPPGWTSGPKTSMVVFANGKFHWCGENCIAAYDPFCKPLQCDLIPFPAMNPLDIGVTGSFILKAFGESLRLVRQSFAFERELMAWDLVDYGNKVWVKNVDVRYRDQGRSLCFESFVGAESAAKDKAYFSVYPSTIMLFNVKNKSFRRFYCPTNLDIGTGTYATESVEQFISSPWPTPVPRLKKRK